MIEIWDGQTDLRHLVEAWSKEWQGECDIEQGMRDLTYLKETDNAEVFVMKTGDEIVGALGITVLDIFFTKDCYSAVRYWYVLPQWRSHAMHLVRHASKWSKEMACEKIMLCSNKLSLPCDDFYKAMGFREYETVYIGDL